MAHRKHRLWTPLNWDDGYIDQGKMKVYRPDYPRSNGQGYTFRYHIVWWMSTGEVVPRDLILHHINGNKLDDSIGNLQLMPQKDHVRLHLTKPEVKISCQWCNKEFRIRPYEKGIAKYCSRKCMWKYIGTHHMDGKEKKK
jgi:hypothetical protein